MYNGVLNIYKPKNFTSHDMVSKVRRITGMKRVGHTGTLDPMAEGVLPLCLGKATRIAEYLIEGDKEYIAAIKLGEETDTLDAEGEVSKKCQVPNLEEEEIKKALQDFTGTIIQVPPLYSAIKKDGKPLYKYARAGKELELEGREVHIYKNELLSYDDQEKIIKIKTHCSKGTYIRSLARDLAQALDTCGHLVYLLRTKSSSFLVEDSLRIEELEKEGPLKHLVSMEDALPDFPSIFLNDEDSQSFALGRKIRLEKTDLPGPEELVKLFDQTDNLLGLGQFDQGLLKPKKVFIENKPRVVCLGNFDGLHIGHQELIRRTVDLAKKNNYASMVLSFYPHPRSFFNENVKYLSSLAEKNRMVRKLGADSLELLAFDQGLASLSAQEFIEKILFKKLSAKLLVVGFDFYFGKDRQGNAQFLKEKAKDYGMEVHIVDPVKISDQIVSTSLIKEFLQEGKMEEARELLGYRPQLAGKVIKGKQMGRIIGFPTANLEYDREKLLPALGVYAVKVFYRRKEYLGMANIGVKPTVKSDSDIEVEVHLLDFSGDLYGQHLRLEFLAKLRDERKFSSLEDLKEQIKIDREQIKKYN